MNPQLKQRIKLGVVAAAFIVLLIVFLQNTEQVTLKILFATFSMPLVAWLVLVLTIGFALGYVSSSLLRRRKLAVVEKTVA